MTALKYQFLPWVRRGLSARIGDVDDLTKSTRASVSISVKLKSKAATQTVARDIQIYGPGDVTGLDPRAIISHSPLANINDFEANYFPTIEFDDPALPWMMTPAKPDGSQRLRPWLVLVVVERSKCTVSSRQGRTVLEVSRSLLPDLSESHYWCHAQVVTASEKAPDLATQTNNNLSRLMCPIKLEKDTSYTAFVVPSFEAGRLAGLGQDAAGAAGYSWSGLTGDVTLPVYYKWDFATRPGEDFEALASLLKPTQLGGSNVGNTSMYIGQSDPGLTAESPDDVVSFFGAMVDTEATAVPANTVFKETLRPILEQPRTTLSAGTASVGQDGLLAERAAPPLYGNWHLLKHAVPASGNEPAWFRDLNLEPRHRAAAGLGAEVVRQHQERFMDEAWGQVGEVNRLNAALAVSELAARTSERLIERSIVGRGEFSTLQVLGLLSEDSTITAHGRIKGSLSLSALPMGAGSVNFRRIAAQTMSRLGTTSAENVCHRFMERASDGNRTAGLGVLPKAQIEELWASLEAVEDPSIRETAAAVLRKATPVSARHRLATATSNDEGAAAESQSRMARPAAADRSYSDGVAEIPEVAAYVHRYFDGVEAEPHEALSLFSVEAGPDEGKVLSAELTGELDSETIVSLQILKANGQPLEGQMWSGTVGNLAANGSIRDGQLLLDLANLPVDEPVSKYSVSSLARALGDGTRLDLAFGGNTSVESVMLVDEAPGSPGSPEANFEEASTADLQLHEIPFLDLDVSALKAEALMSIDVGSAMRATVSSEFAIDGVGIFQAVEASSSLTFDEGTRAVRAYPDLSEPLYKLLAEYDQEVFMPGVGELPPNSVGVLDINEEFVEAFLVGANYEMNRELLWRGYPTDRRGTPFKTFWDYLSTSPTTVDLLDGIETYTTGDLGSHLGGSGSDLTALVIRGDLLRRYPNTSIYLAKSSPSSDGDAAAKVDVTAGKFPVFAGKLGKDLTFLGFEISTDELWPDNGDDAWSFVFEEHVVETRFGLDDATTTPTLESWQDLDWAHITVDASGHISVGSTSAPAPTSTSTSTWLTNAAHAAAITHQRPVRVIVPAKRIGP